MRLPRICILNPNTSPMVSALLVKGALRAAAGRAEIRVETAPFGAPALETAADLARARDAVAEMAAAETRADALIIGAFGDPGLAQLRQRSSRPVTGIGEAGLHRAARFGRFEILTLGPALRQDILDRAEALGVSDRLTRVCFLTARVLELANDPESFREDVLAAASEAKARGAECLLLGGAPFSGLGATFDNASPLPVIDGTTIAVARSLKTVPRVPAADAAP